MSTVFVYEHSDLFPEGPREATELDETIIEYIAAMEGRGEWTARAEAYRVEVREWADLQRSRRPVEPVVSLEAFVD